MKLSTVKHSKSGTAMVEAAVIFPLVVLSVMVIIFILAFINRQVSVQTQMHMNLWAERGIVSKTVETGHEKKGEFPVYKSSSKIRKILYYNIPLSFAKRGLLTKDYTRRMKGKIHVARELDLIRIYDLFLQR